MKRIMLVKGVLEDDTALYALTLIYIHKTIIFLRYF